MRSSLNMNNLEPSAYTISFNALVQRYGVSQGTVSHRIKQLRLKTKRRGNKTFLTANQLAQLDELHRFLQENPGSTIKEFLIYSSNRFRPSLSSDDSINDSISVVIPEQLPQSSQDQALPQSSDDKSLIIEEYRRLIEEQRHIINEQRRIINDYARIIDEHNLEKENNRQQIQEFDQLGEEVKRTILMMKHRLGKYQTHAEMWEDFWLNNFSYPLSEEEAHSISGFIWIKTKLTYDEGSACRSFAAPINERLPRLID
jgi:hypothetical protein